MAVQATRRDFKAHYVVNGQTVGFGSLKCRWTDDGLLLGDDPLPFNAIVDTQTRSNRIVIVLDQQFTATGKMAKRLMQGPVIALQPSGINARDLEMLIDKECSAREAAVRRRELEASGQGHLIREASCPVCESTLDLSGLDRTDYTYCRFCDTLFTSASYTNGGDFRTCDQCGMFDHIRPYTEFYFYFLLLVYGFSYKQVHLCHSCAHKTFLKTLGLNLIFIIGVPSAIWLKVKSMMNRNPQFEGLAKANALAKAGRPMDAEPYFQQVLAQNPRHPAVLMNRAIGQINGGDKNGAVASLQESLRACNHYLPALRMLN